MPELSDTYYLNLLAINEGNSIRWRVGAGGELHKNLQGLVVRGTVLRAYPNGNGQYCTAKDAFFVVAGHRTEQLYSVSYDNPTIEKLETNHENL